MDNNRKLILKEFEQHKGQFVMTPFDKPMRFIAIGSDELDYYYVLYNGAKTTWYSCVGGYIPLKGHLRNKDYNELVRLAHLNHHDLLVKREQPENYDKYIEELTKTEDEYLTEFCFDLDYVGTKETKR